MTRHEKIIAERTDRNGTKHQTVETNCDRCGGKGNSEVWRYTGRTCFKCNGSGLMVVSRKVYTPEYEEKLRLRRKKAEEKKREKIREEMPERNKETLEKFGYHNEKIFAVLGETYSIKNELKENGAIWGGAVIGWYFSEEKEKYETVQLEVSKLIHYGDLGNVMKKFDAEIVDYMNEKKKIEEPVASEWIGEEGQRLDLELKIINSFEFDGFYGTSFVNKLKDSEGNIFVWITSSDLEYMYGDGTLIKMTATIKEHSTFRDEKQTVLTRCRIKKEEVR